MQSKQSERASGRAAGCASDELVDRSPERQRTLLHMLTQLVPGLEAMFASDSALRIVQGEIYCAELRERLACERGQRLEPLERIRISGARRVKKGFGRFSELLQTKFVLAKTQTAPSSAARDQ